VGGHLIRLAGRCAHRNPNAATRRQKPTTGGVRKDAPTRRALMPGVPTDAQPTTPADTAGRCDPEAATRRGREHACFRTSGTGYWSPFQPIPRLRPYGVEELPSAGGGMSPEDGGISARASVLNAGRGDVQPFEVPLFLARLSVEQASPASSGGQGAFGAGAGAEIWCSVFAARRPGERVTRPSRLISLYARPGGDVC